MIAYIDKEKLSHVIGHLQDLCASSYTYMADILAQYRPCASEQEWTHPDMDWTVAQLELLKGLTDEMIAFSLLPPLSMEQPASRIATVLGGMLYALRHAMEDRQESVRSFAGTYAVQSKAFYQQLFDLLQLHDELLEYVRGKSLNKASADWVRGFFDIFREWKQEGGNRDMTTVKQQVMRKILALNKDYMQNPFSNKTNMLALRGEFAYLTIERAGEALYEKMRQQVWIVRKAGRLLAIIRKQVDSLYVPAPVEARRGAAHAFVRARKVCYYAGLAILCFAGGWWLGYHRRDTMPARASSVLLAQGSLPGGGQGTGRGPLAPGAERGPLASGAERDSLQDAERHDSLTGVSGGGHSVPDTVNPAHLPFPGLATIPHVYGIDLSKYQGDLLEEIKQLDTLHFVICKATEGNTLIDARFIANWQRLRQLAVLRGVYHFYISKDDPIKQAQHFLKTLGDVQAADIPLILDVEEESLRGVIDTANFHQSLLSFLHYLEQQSHQKPIIYTDPSFADQYLRNSSFADYPLWIADYTKKESPVLPVTWKKKGYVFWQRNDSHTLHSQRTDFDVFNGDGAALIAFLRRK